MSNVSYRVGDSSGYTIYDSLADMDAFLSRKIKRGSLTFAVPIKKIEKVTIEDVPLTKVVMRYNEKVEKEKTEGETK